MKIKKRDGRIEEYVESKIVTGVKKAGATVEDAEHVAKEVAEKMIHRTEVTAAELSRIVVASLRKLDRKAADEFVKFRDDKLKAKNKK